MNLVFHKTAKSNFSPLWNSNTFVFFPHLDKQKCTAIHFAIQPECSFMILMSCLMAMTNYWIESELMDTTVWWLGKSLIQMEQQSPEFNIYSIVIMHTETNLSLYWFWNWHTFSISKTSGFLTKWILTLTSKFFSRFIKISPCFLCNVWLYNALGFFRFEGSWTTMVQLIN